MSDDSKRRKQVTEAKAKQIVESLQRAFAERGLTLTVTSLEQLAPKKKKGN